ncbi:potassium voltage-gated channel subfamily A member 1-like [Styela clava]
MLRNGVMAMYVPGESPSIAKKDLTPSKANGKKAKGMFSRGKSPDNLEENLIKTCLKKQKSDAGKEYRGERVRLNISGMLYETRLKTLKRYPTTLLGNEETREAYYDEETGEYFFDRDRQTFDSVLRFYQTGGILIKPTSVPEDIFYKELGFYKLDQFLQKPEDNTATATELYEAKMPKGRRMRMVWRLMEEPASSIGAKIISILSVTVIFLSIWSFCIETLPSSKELLEDLCVPFNDTLHEGYATLSITTVSSHWPSAVNGTEVTTVPTHVTATTSTVKPPCRVDMLRYPFFIIETFCVICFTIELIVRFVVTPNKISFMKSPLNIIDIAAILPYFIQLGVDIHTGSSESNSSEDSLNSLVVLRILRLVRILRVFKLSRYSTKLRVLGRTLIASVGELSILVFFIFLAMILFSTVVYFIESTSGPGNKFDSIPASFWWAVVTMTTVGYGDVVPRTVLGKIVGFLCAITGVLCIALPVPSIVNNFVKQLEEAENPTRKTKRGKKRKGRRSVIDRVKTVLNKEAEFSNHVSVNVDEAT